uniref:SWIRM domain-containing protein n=1 Tax=Physcomitrium patens TaxID=3218 RepID=A0A7I4BMG7_PHYPA
MVNPASVPTESSKVRREREEKDAAIETPSRKSRKAGKNGAAGVAGDARVQITAGKGEDRNNGTLGGNAERGPQGVAGSIGGEGNPGSVDPSAAPAATAEGASRPEAPGEVVYRIPSYAGWFRWDKVHPLERRAMSEFFDKRSAAKTPRMYKECRDFTINRCRENLKQAVTFQEVALLAGAVGPRVASAAAQAAVAAIAEDEPGVWEVPFMRRSKVVSVWWRGSGMKCSATGRARRMERKRRRRSGAQVIRGNQMRRRRVQAVRSCHVLFKLG